MRPCWARDGDPLTTLAQWYRTPLGRRVADAESACLEQLLEDSFGYYLLQIGLPERFRGAMSGCRIRHRVVLSTTAVTAARPEARIQGAPSRLPIASDSVDALLLPHTLDFAADAQQVLREAERVLIPEGRVLILGFNPISAWGLWRAIPRRRQRVPWCGEILTPFRVCDWLTLIGFQIERRQTLMHRLPLRGRYLTRLDWLDQLGARWWPALGGIYAIRAVKRVSTVTPVRPRWTRRPTILPGRGLEPTARGSSDG